MIQIIEQYPVISNIAIFFLGVLVTIIGFFIKRHFFSNPPKKSFTPKLHISPLAQKDSLFAEITNLGNDPIQNLEVSIEWLQDGTKQQRQINSFFNYNEDPVLTHGHDCKFLDVKEKKKISSLPQYSDDGKIIFITTGKGVLSSKEYQDNFVINNTRR